MRKLVRSENKAPEESEELITKNNFKGWRRNW